MIFNDFLVLYYMSIYLTMSLLLDMHSASVLAVKGILNYYHFISLIFFNFNVLDYFLKKKFNKYNGILIILNLMALYLGKIR